MYLHGGEGVIIWFKSWHLFDVVNLWRLWVYLYHVQRLTYRYARIYSFFFLSIIHPISIIFHFFFFQTNDILIPWPIIEPISSIKITLTGTPIGIKWDWKSNQSYGLGEPAREQIARSLYKCKWSSKSYVRNLA